MPSTRQLRRPSIGMQNSRRARGTRSSFQGLIAVCIGVAFTITILRILQDPQLPSGQQMPSPKALRGETTAAAAISAQPVSGGVPNRPEEQQPPAVQGPPNGASDGHGGSSESITPSREVGFVEVKVGLGGGGDHGTPRPVRVVGVGAGGTPGGTGEGGGNGGGGGGGEQAAVENFDKFLTVPSEDDDMEDHGSSSGGGSKAGEEGPGNEKQPPAGEPINSYNGEVVSGGGARNGEDQGVPAVGVAAGAKDPVVAAAAGALVSAAAEGGGAAPAGAGVLANLDPDNVRREERRDRLNRLVEEAVAKQRGSECNVAFIKTHKTASTTLTAVLYRYGLRHARRVARFKVEGTAVTLEHAARETQESGNRVEIFHYHHVWNGYYEASWDKARALFSDIMAQPGAPGASGAGSDVVGSGTKYVTVLREPKAHWLSYFYFYYQPEMNIGVEEYFKSGKNKIRPLKDPLAAEFGIYNDRDLDEFILNYLPTFALTMLTEELDEGLVLLGRIMGWDPIDLTYASLLEARDGATRWDDKPIMKAPRPKDLHSSTLLELERATSLDSRLYEAAKEAYEQVKELHSEGFEEEVAQLRELQSDVSAILNEGVGRAGKVSPARAWYMPESDYYFYSADKSRWWEEYYPAALPF